MPINDNWHVHAGRDCCTSCAPGFTFPAMPPMPPLAFPPPSPKCPATTRHAPLHASLQVVGLQCKYEPGHDGDHAAHAGFGEGDVFWPQEATEAVS